jgi:hypothetical protein
VISICSLPFSFSDAFAARSFAPAHSLVVYVSPDQVRIYDRGARQWVHENPLAGTTLLFVGLGGLATAAYLLWMRKKLNGA